VSSPAGYTLCDGTCIVNIVSVLLYIESFVTARQ